MLKLIAHDQSVTQRSVDCMCISPKNIEMSCRKKQTPPYFITQIFTRILTAVIPTTTKNRGLEVFYRGPKITEVLLRVLKDDPSHPLDNSIAGVGLTASFFMGIREFFRFKDGWTAYSLAKKAAEAGLVQTQKYLKKRGFERTFWGSFRGLGGSVLGIAYALMYFGDAIVAYANTPVWAVTQLIAVGRSSWEVFMFSKKLIRIGNALSLLKGHPEITAYKNALKSGEPRKITPTVAMYILLRNKRRDLRFQLAAQIAQGVGRLLLTLLVLKLFVATVITPVGSALFIAGAAFFLVRLVWPYIRPAITNGYNKLRTFITGNTATTNNCDTIDGQPKSDEGDVKIDIAINSDNPLPESTDKNSDISSAISASAHSANIELGSDVPAPDSQTGSGVLPNPNQPLQPPDISAYYLSSELQATYFKTIIRVLADAQNNTQPIFRLAVIAAGLSEPELAEFYQVHGDELSSSEAKTAVTVHLKSLLTV